MDPIFYLILLLILAGLALYIIPMDEAIKGIVVKVILVVTCVVLLIWVLSAFGIMPHGGLHLTR